MEMSAAGPEPAGGVHAKSRGSLLFHQLMRRWIALGIPAFIAVMIIVVLMVTSFGATTRLGMSG
jgi:uncharacterized membrane protein